MLGEREAVATLPAFTLTRAQGWGIVLLITACLTGLPVVYLLVSIGAPPYAVLAAGLMCMASAWSGAFFLERKRLPLARGLALFAALEAALIALPTIREAGASGWAVLGGGLSLVGLAMCWQRR